MDVSCVWGQDVPSIKGFSRCRGYYNISLSTCCVHIDIFGWLCRATYCSVESAPMLGVSHAIQNEKKLEKFTESDSVYLLYLVL